MFLTANLSIKRPNNYWDQPSDQLFDLFLQRPRLRPHNLLFGLACDSCKRNPCPDFRHPHFPSTFFLCPVFYLLWMLGTQLVERRIFDPTIRTPSRLPPASRIRTIPRRMLLCTKRADLLNYAAKLNRPKLLAPKALLLRLTTESTLNP